MRATRLAIYAAALALLWPSAADAFCGFYVGGAGSELFNNATQVVMLRDGTRTVLSMQNNYQGPPENFAMVIPVPVVLHKENVKTLPKEIFGRVEQLDSPRLVEYWEQDPCRPGYPEEKTMAAPTAAAVDEAADDKDSGYGVKIEAQFVVGEYQIVVLSAKESTGLERWLHDNNYVIPQGAEKYLRPYVQSGMKFFVAKVDIKKVKMVNGMAALSPLRFYYDTPDFALPIRLGLMNAKGKQDLIVHILARGKRYDVANHPNVTIPTNLDLEQGTKARFGEFYAALFDATLEKNPNAVVTEYSWDANSCDPCPTPALQPQELATLGVDVLAGAAKPGSADSWQQYQGWVLTRLHARYGDELKDDLVFRAAPAIAGGREFVVKDGVLEKGSQPSSVNNFQARYAIRHPWTGPIECDHPSRGRWGGPPSGGEPAPTAARDLAFAPRGKMQLASAVAEDIPELKVVAAAGAAATPAPRQHPRVPDSRRPGRIKKGCSCAGGSAADTGGLLLCIAAVMLAARRRRC